MEIIDKDITNNEYTVIISEEEIEDLLSNRIPRMKPVIILLEREYKEIEGMTDEELREKMDKRV